MARLVAGNAVVASKWAALFGSEELADCTIQFVQSQQSQSPAVRRSKRRRVSADANDVGPAETIGSALPGHAFVLRFGAEWFESKFNDMKAKQQEAVSAAASVAAPVAPQRQLRGRTQQSQSLPPPMTSASPGRPILRIPLGSPEEVPSARAAIQYAYTGQVQAGSIREALEIWRQAGYLQVHKCDVDCLELVKQKLAEPARSDGASTSTAEAPIPPILELYACESLWRGLETGPEFASMLAAAKPLLVSHFGNALAALNRPALREQLLALPACALEALLESDDFGTDTEDSVLLLLATWMQRNRGSTDAATRERLCRLVRLAQLSPAYTNAILPGLAEANGGWFSIGHGELAVFNGFASIKSDTVSGQLMKAASKMYDTRSPWYSTQRRRQCMSVEPPAAFEWHIAAQELRQSLSSEQPGKTAYIRASSITARGFEWQPKIEFISGQTAAGLYLGCILPLALQAEGSWLSSGKVAAVVQIDARIEMFGWQGGVREVAWGGTYDTSNFIMVFGDWGWHHALPLQQQEAAGGGGQGSDSAPSLAPWAKYLHEGKVWGKLVLLPPST